MTRHDPSLDTLLDLDGQVLVIDEAGYWAKFVIHRVPVTLHKPHGLDYSLSLHGPDGTRLMGFDNAHAVGGSRRSEHDHKHRLRTVRPYDYQDATKLVSDFWAAVESLMHDEGVWS